MKPWAQPISEDTEKKIIKLMEICHSTKLLDFGAGNGRYLNMFAKYMNKENLFCVEIDKRSIEILIEQGYKCFKSDYDNSNIPIDNEYFDYIFSSNVIEHIPNKEYKLYLKEFFRILKPGGRLIIGTPNYPFKRLYDIKKAFQTKMFKYYFFDDPSHINKLSFKKLERDLKEIFPIVKLESTYIFFENKFRFIRDNRFKFRFFCDKIFGYCEK